mmetsp:Transcript_33552/g.106436  ORF Transcript_33552/g.106436 Transcript_33552/m.106436 type:complete len:277 (+) Transcript_33552:786-1616(+)
MTSRNCNPDATVRFEAWPETQSALTVCPAWALRIRRGAHGPCTPERPGIPSRRLASALGWRRWRLRQGHCSAGGAPAPPPAAPRCGASAWPLQGQPRGSPPRQRPGAPLVDSAAAPEPEAGLRRPPGLPPAAPPAQQWPALHPAQPRLGLLPLQPAPARLRRPRPPLERRQAPPRGPLRGSASTRCRPRPLGTPAAGPRRPPAVQRLPLASGLSRHVRREDRWQARHCAALSSGSRPRHPRRWSNGSGLPGAPAAPPRCSGRPCSQPRCLRRPRTR